jgi:hypothetical protein
MINRENLIGLLRNQMPEELAEALVQQYSVILSSYWRKDYSGCAVWGGRFSEVFLRVLQKLILGTYTPLSDKLPPTIDSIFKQLENSTGHDSLRLIIPRLIRVVYDFRNRRDGAHVGSDISSNYVDSHLIVVSAKWMLSELIRSHESISNEEAVWVIDSLVKPLVPLLEEVNGRVVINNPNIGFKDRILLFLNYSHPNAININDLYTRSKYKNKSVFRNKILHGLESDCLLSVHGEDVALTTLGLSNILYKYSGFVN